MGYWGGGVPIIFPIISYVFQKGRTNVEKENSQNGLRMYPKMFPHQLRAICTYPNPPICHIGKSKKSMCFAIFLFFLTPGIRLVENFESNMETKKPKKMMICYDPLIILISNTTSLSRHLTGSMLIGSRRLIQWCDTMNILLKSAPENNTHGRHAEIRAEDLAMSIYFASQKD